MARVALYGGGGSPFHHAALLAAGGHEVRIYTRRDNPALPELVPLGERGDVQLRDEAIRSALEPLREDERPAALLVAVGVACLLAIAIAVSAVSVHDLNRHGGSVPGAIWLPFGMVVIVAMPALGPVERSGREAQRGRK